MFVKHKGDSILEWMVIAVIVIVVIGITIVNISQSAQGAFGRLQNYVQ